MLQAGFNKSTTTFHGLYSYRLQKWRQNVQNSNGTTTRRRVVSLQSFEHLDVISMVDKSTDHVIVKNNNIYSLDVHFCWSFSENRAQEKEKNKLCHHDVIFMVCTLIKHIALDQSACEKLSQKYLDFVLEICLAFIQPDTSTNTSNTPVSKSVQDIRKTTRHFVTKKTPNTPLTSKQ